MTAAPKPRRSKALLGPMEEFFATQGWKPFPFQLQSWKAYLAGESGLIQVATGAGKTYAAVGGAFAEMLSHPQPGLKLLYITPLRAVARDIEQALQLPIQKMNWPLRVESRTGDTSQNAKKKQLKNLPDVLITTPESLELMLSQSGAAQTFKYLQGVVLDEWHELLGSKRGTLLELSLTRLRALRPELRTWALSATLANPQEAAQVALGWQAEPRIISANMRRKTVLHSLLPERLDSFPWAGHLGMNLLPALVEKLDINRSTLIFTNTRRQAERWFQGLLKLVPQHAGQIALHHSSISRLERERVEAGVKSGSIRWVVATSSLDLGVDFHPVERVVQIGSPKGIARLLQRAGRAAHQPGGTSEVWFVPTQALELLELSAAREALSEGAIEARRALVKPYDVLVQHLITLACGDGFAPDETLPQLRGSWAYQHLSDQEFEWALELIERGGKSLGAYPEYRKVVFEDGLYKIASRAMAGRHRQSIGTITSEGQVAVKYTNRGDLGSVSEGFISRLKKGDVFTFAGRQLELVMVRDMTAYVRNTTKRSTTIPSWLGSRFAISDSLSHYLRRQWAKPHTEAGESEAIAPILRAQSKLSRLPTEDQLLVEEVTTKEGSHLFVYPFEGTHVHEGLGALLTYRMAAIEAGSFALTVNDYGLEILGRKGYPFEGVFAQALAQTGDLDAELVAALNMSELAKRSFREIAQIAGLIYPGRPGARKTNWQLQTSASTLYNTYRAYEPESLLLRQAEREVLEEALEGKRLGETLKRLQGQKLVYLRPKRPTPLGFPLLVDRLSTRMSNEDLLLRIMRMKQQWLKYE